MPPTDITHPGAIISGPNGMTTTAFDIASAILARDDRVIILAVDDIPSLCHPDN